MKDVEKGQESDRLIEIDRLFAAALDLPPADRAAWLAERAAGDAELVREVELLLRLSEREAIELVEPLRRLVRDAAEPIVDGLAIGQRVGAWTIERPIGRGGMGIVYEVRRQEGGFEQRGALKILPLAGSSAEAIRRFEQERRIVARLEHPSIARLIDGGVDDRGLPFLVLELVDGEPVDAHCDRLRLPIEARIALVAEIARAVQVAHRNLVVHRDLKPSNLLVTAEGRVKLLDFGIARPIEGDSDDSTRTAGLALTPACASPEQVRGEAITTASDVYQLGLLLYTLLTGHRPQRASFSSLSTLVREVCELSPGAPSARVLRDGERPAAELAALRASTPTKLARRLRGELDAIVAKAIEKPPERRYPSAEALAADLERFLSGQPVEARRTSRVVRARLWIGRNRGLAAAIALAAMLAAGYAVTVTAQARALARERDRARLEAQKASEVERFVLGLFEVSDPAQSLGRSVDAVELLERGAARVEAELAAQPAIQARMLSTLGQIYGRLGRLAEGRKMEERSLDLRRACFGPRHAEVAESLHRLGMLARKLGDHAAAEPWLLEAVAQRRELLGPAAGELGDSLTELGHLRYFAGDYGAAEALFVESLAIRRQGGDRAAIAAGLNSLALVAEKAGRLEDAERFNREALAVNRELHGALHPEVAISLFNLARVHQRRQDYAGAQPLFEQVLAIDREVYGEEHPEVATDMSLLGNNLQILGRLDEADAMFARAIAIYRAHFEPGHHRIATTLQGIAQLRLAQGRVDEAIELLEEALALRRARVGDHHVEVAELLLPLGRCHLARGDRATAAATWNAALAMAEGGDPLLARQLRGELAQLVAPKV